METTTRLNDEEAHDLAVRHLADLLGSTTLPEIAWDVDHHLQGHLDVAGHHMRGCIRTCPTTSIDPTLET